MNDFLGPSTAGSSTDGGARAVPISPFAGNNNPKRKRVTGMSISGLSSKALPMLAVNAHPRGAGTVRIKLASPELIHKCSRSSCGRKEFHFRDQAVPPHGREDRDLGHSTLTLHRPHCGDLGKLGTFSGPQLPHL